MNNVDINIADALVPAIIVFFALFSLVMMIRILFHVFIFILSKIYRSRPSVKRVIPQSKVSANISAHKNEESELLRDFKLEEKQMQDLSILENVQRMNRSFEEQMEVVKQGERIVGMVKPIGFWTSLILGDQLSQILGRAQAINDKFNKGFWVSMMEAQARGLRRQHIAQR